jgi:aromatic ring-cleaving dioxygenase
MYYHCHIYFELKNLEQLNAFIQKIIAAQFPVRIFPPVNRPVGPHPLPMVEIHFLEGIKMKFKDFLEKEREHHTILIHQNTGHDHQDHSLGAEWLGEPLTLDFTVFRT